MSKPTEKVFRGLNQVKSYIEKNKFQQVYDLLEYGITGTKGELITLSSKEIGSVTEMFYNSGILDQVLLNLTKIPSYMFTLVNIPTIVLPPNITKIGGWAFERSGVENIQIPESVVQIGAEAFRSCKNLKELRIPRSVTSLSVQSTFYGCDNLKKVWIPLHLKGKVSKSRMCGSSKAITKFIYY